MQMKEWNGFSYKNILEYERKIMRSESLLLLRRSFPITHRSVSSNTSRIKGNSSVHTKVHKMFNTPKDES